MKIETCLVGTLAEMTAIAAAVDRALGYPRKGVHVGGGRHVDIPMTWDGTGPLPPGWSRTSSEPVELDDDTYALVIGHASSELSQPAARALLTGPERARLAQTTALDLKARRKATPDAAAQHFVTRSDR